MAFDWVERKRIPKERESGGWFSREEKSRPAKKKGVLENSEGGGARPDGAGGEAVTSPGGVHTTVYSTVWDTRHISIHNNYSLPGSSTLDSITSDHSQIAMVPRGHHHYHHHQ